MNMLLIGGQSKHHEEAQDMERYAAYYAVNPDQHVTYVHFDQLSFVIGRGRFEIFDHRNNQPMENYDLIIFRGKLRANVELAYCVSRFCINKNITFFNDYTPYRPASKVAQAVTLFELNLPAPLTVYSADKTILGKLIADQLTYPLIIKSSMGSHGNDNYLSKSAEQTGQILRENSSLPLIGQSFFPNKCDYRLLCMGDRELIIRRTATGETHLNNTSQGGKADLVEPGFLPVQAIRDAHTLADALKMSIAGVDLLYNEETGEYVVLEINSQPQLTDGAFPEHKRKLLGEFLKSFEA